MKNVLILILLFICFETKSQTTQDSIHIPTTVARKIVKDLIDYDATKEVLKKTEETLRATEQKVNYKDGVITTYRSKEANYLKQLEVKKKEKELWNEQIIIMDNRYKKLNKNRKIERVAFIVITGVLGTLYATK